MDTSASSLSVEQSPLKQSLKRKSNEPPRADGNKARVLVDDKGDSQVHHVQSDNSTTADDDKKGADDSDANKSARDSFGGQRGITSADALEEPVDEIRLPLVTLYFRKYCWVPGFCTTP